MAQRLPQVQAEPACKAALDIPWLRRWEHRSAAKTPKDKEDLYTRLSNIEYMNMLEELEFH